ncbi:MAG: hypothetical protein QJR03_07315 [Sphaerobacter sp.]|nr:hypothetical protein [Sphaerobacter sp.]
MRSGMRLGHALLLAGALALATTLGAAAESFPTRVILSHVPTMTTWGPSDANGVVLVNLAEGDIRADLVGLPALDHTERYQLWLLNSTSGETYALARFTAEAGATTYVDQLLPTPIPDRGWDVVLVTVEPEPDPDPGPDARRVLAGTFPGTPAETQQFPPTLPQTGIPTRPEARGALMLLGLDLALFGALAVARRVRRPLPRPAVVHREEEAR